MIKILKLKSFFFFSNVSFSPQFFFQTLLFSKKKKVKAIEIKFWEIILIMSQVAQRYCSTLAEYCPTTACIGTCIGQYCPILAQQY